jgi:hypothetical protein
MTLENRFFLTLFMAVFAGIIVISSCDRGEDDVQPAHNADHIAIEPEGASIGIGEEIQFSAVILTASGDTVDTSGLDVEWQWWSTDPGIFTVEESGLATGEDAGEAYCVAEATILVGSSNFTGRDSVFVSVF